MKAKEFLNQYKNAMDLVYRCESEYKEAVENIDAIGSTLSGDGQPHGTGVSRKTEDKALDLVEAREKWAKAKRDAFNIRQEVVDLIIDIPDIEADANRIPVLDLRTAAGFEYVTLEDTMTLSNPPVAEYVTMSGLKGCVGLYVYGDSMSPEYRAGDIVFVRKEPELDGIDYGRAYMIVTASERVLKCIYKSNHDADLIRLVSINEDVNRHGDRLFPDREMRKDNIIAVYRVEGVFRRERM